MIQRENWCLGFCKAIGWREGDVNRFKTSTWHNTQDVRVSGTVASSSTTARGVITNSLTTCSFANMLMYVVCSVSHYTDLTWAHSSPVQDLLNKTVEVYLILSTVRLSSKPPDLRSVFLVGVSPVTMVVWDVAVNGSWCDWSDWSSLCSGESLWLPSSSVLRPSVSWRGDREQPVTTSNSSCWVIGVWLHTTTHHHINFVVYYYY